MSGIFVISRAFTYAGNPPIRSHSPSVIVIKTIVIAHMFTAMRGAMRSFACPLLVFAYAYPPTVIYQRPIFFHWAPVIRFYTPVSVMQLLASCSRSNFLFLPLAACISLFFGPANILLKPPLRPFGTLLTCCCVNTDRNSYPKNTALHPSVYS